VALSPENGLTLASIIPAAARHEGVPRRPSGGRRVLALATMAATFGLSTAMLSPTGAQAEAGLHVVHVPVVVAPYLQPVHLSATATCATSSCSATLSYRRSAGLTSAFALAGYLAGQPPFTTMAMGATVVQDLGIAGTVMRFDADIPAAAVTTDGVDYSMHFSDGATNAYWPGTAYVGGVASVDGQALAWQHIEVLLRNPVLAIAHAPVPAVPFRTAVPLRFSAYCTADRPCAATAWYRSTPTTFDASQVLGSEPAWLQAPVRVVSVQPNTTGLVLYVFETEIPADAVDSRGVDYLLKVADSERRAYWPEVPAETVSGIQAPPLVAEHISTLSSPLIVHAPLVAAAAGSQLSLTWWVVCAVDDVSQCRTAAYHRHLNEATAGGVTVTVGGGATTYGTPAPFAPVATTTRVVASQNGYMIIEAQASVTASAVAGSFEQYFLWATDANTNAYSPGTTYQGAVVPIDGINLGGVVPWTVAVIP
jgi:hypothetical protein